MPKCQHHAYDTDTIRTTGAGFSRFFNVQNKKFQALSCQQCGFTELYKEESGMLGSVLDFFTG